MRLVDLSFGCAEEMCQFFEDTFGFKIECQKLGIEASQTRYKLNDINGQLLTKSLKGSGAFYVPNCQYAPDEFWAFEIDRMPRFMEGIHIQPGELIIQRGSHALVTATFVDACGVCVLDSVMQRLFTPRARAIVQDCGSLQISPDAQDQFRAFHAEVEVEQHSVEKVCQFLSKLIEASTQQFNNKRVEGWQMGVELVELAHSQTPDNLLKLPDVSRMLLSNKNKVSATAKTLFDLTPMQLVRNVRLWQCRNLLADGSSMKKAGLASVEAVRIAYGFSNRKDFNERYERLFNEIPTETKNIA